MRRAAFLRGDQRRFSRCAREVTSRIDALLPASAPNVTAGARWDHIRAFKQIVYEPHTLLEAG